MINLLRLSGIITVLLLCISTHAKANIAPPPNDQVFKFSVTTYDPNTFIVHWKIKPGFFLYQDSIKLVEPKNEEKFAEITELKLPLSSIKTDSRGKTFEVYREHLQIPVTVLGQHAGETLIEIKAQGCADDGFCYPPKTTTIQLTFDKHLALTKTEISTSLLPNKATKHLSIKDMLDNPFASHHSLITLIIFLGLGLLLSFTPCVLPMIPVLSGIIVGRGHAISTRHAFFLSLSYVLSMSFTYALIGAVIAKMGQNLQILMQTPLVIVLFSSLFILLALAMFNVYELRIPTSWQAKLANLSYHQARGHYLGAIIMGFLSTLILSPCVTAPLIGALSYIAQTGNVLLGLCSLFMLGLGMGIPLLLIGTSLGKWLPHAGGWMNRVKGFFGIILLGIAIDLISRILTPLIVMILWSILFIFSALYFGVFPLAKSNLGRLRQGIALALFVYGLLILVGASQGNTNPWRPLSHTKMLTTQSQALIVTSTEEVERALSNARQENKPVMIDFYADWCRSCKIIENKIQHDATIQTRLQSFVIIKADITENNEQTARLSQQFNVIAPPTFIFMNAEGEPLEDLRFVGEVSLKQLNAALKTTLTSRNQN